MVANRRGSLAEGDDSPQGVEAASKSASSAARVRAMLRRWKSEKSRPSVQHVVADLGLGRPTRIAWWRDLAALCGR